MEWRMRGRDRRAFGLVGLGSEEVRVGGWIVFEACIEWDGRGLL